MRVRWYLRKYARSPYYYYRLTDAGKVIQDWRSTAKTRRRDAEEYADQQANAAAAATHPVTVDEAFKVLAEHKERKGSSDATFEIMNLKASHIRTYFGPARDVRTLGLADTTAYMDKRRADGVSDSTIEKELRELRAALRQLKLRGRLDMDPASLWPPELRRSFPGRKRWLTWEEYLKVAAAIIPQWRDHLAVYVGTGIRYSELYRLEAADLQGDHLHVRGTKTAGSNRTIPLGPDALAVLRRRASVTPSGPLFPVTTRPVNPHRATAAEMEASQKRAWLRALDKACERASVPGASTNDLRRTFVSWAWHRGVSTGSVIGWMGHGSAQMVLQVYAQPSLEHGRNEMAKMPQRQSPSSHPETITIGGNGGSGGKKNGKGFAE